MAAADEKQIDDIVSMLDEFMLQGGGHMNIQVSEDGRIKAGKTMAKKVTTTNSSDCSAGNLACNVPTLFEGMDHEEDPEYNGTDFEDNY